MDSIGDAESLGARPSPSRTHSVAYTLVTVKAALFFFRQIWYSFGAELGSCASRLSGSSIILDISAMSPIEALTKLYELQTKLREGTA